MRKNIVAGNWKMNKDLAEGITLIREINGVAGAIIPKCEIVVGTPFIHLAEAVKLTAGGHINIAAQNCSDKASGAYTGEISAQMVKSTGARYVILGHSERRAYYGETGAILKEKVNLALANGLRPIFCIGELLAEREAGCHFEVVKTQIKEALFHLSLDEFGQIVIAYEPVWAIGTGKTATAAQAQEMHAFIRRQIAEKYGAQTADDTTILYGGSCNPANAHELFANPDVDGGLIGGASLKAADFTAIINSF